MAAIASAAVSAGLASMRACDGFAVVPRLTLISWSMTRKSGVRFFRKGHAQSKSGEGVLSRAGGAVEAKRDHTGVFCCIDDAPETVDPQRPLHPPLLRCLRPPGVRTVGI